MEGNFQKEHNGCSPAGWLICAPPPPNPPRIPLGFRPDSGRIQNQSGRINPGGSKINPPEIRPDGFWIRADNPPGFYPPRIPPGIRPDLPRLKSAPDSVSKSARNPPGFRPDSCVQIRPESARIPPGIRPEIAPESAPDPGARVAGRANFPVRPDSARIPPGIRPDGSFREQIRPDPKNPPRIYWARFPIRPDSARIPPGVMKCRSARNPLGFCPPRTVQARGIAKTNSDHFTKFQEIIFF